MKRLLLPLMALFLLTIFAPISAQDEDITLTYWTWKAFHIPGLETTAEAFEAETGISVEFEFFNPDDAYRSRIQTAAQSGDLPDIVAFWSTEQFDLAASGLLVEVSEQIDEDWQSIFLPNTFETRSTWTQARFDACAADINCLLSTLEVGSVYSVPMAAGSSGIVYANKAMLEEAGIDPTFVPANTDEWLDMMQAVHEATDQGLTIGGVLPDIIRNWVVDDLAITNCGPEAYVAMIEATGEASFTDECAVQAYSFVGDVAERGLWQPGFQTLTIDEADISFMQEQAAFLVGGSYTLGFLIQQGMDPNNIHAFPLPALPTAQQNPIALAPVSLIDIGVTTSSEHPEAALEFIKFLTSADNMVQFARITGELPATQISTDPEVAGQLMSNIAGSYVNAADSFRVAANWPPLGLEVWDALNNAVNRQVTGEGDLVSSLEEADEAAQFDASEREG